ncbi:MAG: Carboxyvinyl-carboxyphosphonate phosphorylmutase [Magnetococcales bacterium]|nr:Carboxyvinyl-carboxyphosphonate phosphorylmutase [Magnetococcales bacterium]HIJ82960.1 isocitrate lyase/PEP mutase family protein [Magnetococcales bacterium]
MTAGEKLRQLLARPGIKIAPAVYDCLGAMIAEQVGLELIFSGGFSISAAKLGKPDMGYLTATEMIDAARAISRATSLPVIADMDTGYGNPLNVVRTIEEVVACGVAGVILEDQVWPKRCGHMEGKQVIGVAEHCEKIRAARFAAGDSGLVIIARTDARAIHGLDDAMKRGEQYLQAGADMLFVEAPRTREELATVARNFPQHNLFANIIEGGKTPNLSAKELEDMGYKVVVFALSGLFAVTEALLNCFTHLQKSGTTQGLAHTMDFTGFEQVIRMDKHRLLEEKFLPIKKCEVV